MKILIAEDEPSMQKILLLYLEKEGYDVSITSNGQEAMEVLWTGSFDLLITDWMMPVMNGIDLCKQIRQSGLPIKIIMLTAKDLVLNEITGLSNGADDYIRKPFEPKLLLLRIQKLFRIEEGLSCGVLRLLPEAQSVWKQEAEIKLTQKEFLLLQIFLLNKGITLTRETLLDRVWGNEYDGDERTLDTHIRRLRQKIGKEYITTYVGLGYRMEDIPRLHTAEDTAVSHE